MTVKTRHPKTEGVGEVVVNHVPLAMSPVRKYARAQPFQTLR
jgi:hypothetical protein